MLQTLTNHDGSKRQIHMKGWHKQQPDNRDHEYTIKSNLRLAKDQPTSVDLRSQDSFIEDQEEEGSCTANAFAGLVQFNERILNLPSTLKAIPNVVVANVTTNAAGVIIFQVSVDPKNAPTPQPTPPQPKKKLILVSRQFHYYATRLLEDTTDSDSGASIRDTFRAGMNYGVIDENLWPYSEPLTQNPPKNIWDTAAQKKITNYHWINDGDIATMKAVLAGMYGVPYLIEYGMTVYDYMLSQECASKGILPRPGPNEQVRGGHAIDLCGYNDNMQMPDGSKGAFLVRNSWGKNWGQAGYFWMAYNYVGDNRFCNDFGFVQSAPFLIVK